MCFSTPSTPAPPPTPEPPAPAPTRQAPEVGKAREDTRKRIRASAGAASNIRNTGGSQGVLTPSLTTAAFQQLSPLG